MAGVEDPLAPGEVKAAAEVRQQRRQLAELLGRLREDSAVPLDEKAISAAARRAARARWDRSA